MQMTLNVTKNELKEKMKELKLKDNVYHSLKKSKHEYDVRLNEALLELDLLKNEKLLAEKTICGGF